MSLSCGRVTTTPANPSGWSVRLRRAFGRSAAEELGLRLGTGRQPDFAGGDVGQRQCHDTLAPGERAKVVGRGGVQRGVRCDGAGGDHADNIAGHEAFHFGGVGHLLADGDPVAAADELRDMTVDAVIGHACEGDAQVLPHRLGRQGDLELARDELRVVIEGFVEVAEAEEQDRVRVALLQLEVLEPDGGGHAARLRQAGYAILPAGERMCFRRNREAG